MPSGERSVLGIDLSTQSLSAVLLGCASGQVLREISLAYRDDPRLQGFGIDRDSLILPPRETGEAEQPPRLFIAALEALFADLVATGVDGAAIAAINCSGQQHGHVYLDATADAALARLRDAKSADQRLLALVGDCFAYPGAPIWKTANTACEAAHIRSAVGGSAAMIARSGSDIPLRFSANMHRRIALRQPQAYAATRRIVQLSSLIPAILAGDAGIGLDFANACGTGLMNYRQRVWDEVLLRATAADLPGGPDALAKKLPRLMHPLTICASIAAYFQVKYGLAADCRIVVGSGDNPQARVLASGDLLSLGTSFVSMMSTQDGETDASGMANAMYDGLGRAFIFGCRSNGALVWDRLRTHYGLPRSDFAASEAALHASPPGTRLRLWHPDSESFPPLAATPDMLRLDDAPTDFAGDFAGLVDSALALTCLAGRRFGLASPRAQTPLTVCGGPSASAGVMRRIAALWNRPAVQAGQAGAALGAALAAVLALQPEARRETSGEHLRQTLFAHNTVFLPDPATVRAYHAPGAYLDRLSGACAALTGERITL